MDITDTQKIKEKVLEERLTNLTQITKLFIEGLIENTNEVKVPEELLRFLGTMFTDKGYLPQDFMFEFELERVQFHPKYGYLFNVKPK